MYSRGTKNEQTSTTPVWLFMSESVRFESPYRSDKRRHTAYFTERRALVNTKNIISCVLQEEGEDDWP